MLVKAFLFIFGVLVVLIQLKGEVRSFTINQNSPVFVTPNYFTPSPKGGDTIFIESGRTESVLFSELEGNELLPITIINKGGIVNINSTNNQSAIEFRSCKHIKFIGSGTTESVYGFKLSAINSGISVNRQSSNIEIGHVEIDHQGFFGIVVKDDYYGKPPEPIPVFEKLAIHNCLIKNVTESMYLGETRTPGMEFRHVRVYNNIMYNNGREGIQIANMVDDVEVYNNLILNSGLTMEGGQGNNIQIGDNTIGNFYNNIVMNAHENGFIEFGSGDINIYNNYIANNRGLFIDNRKVTDALAEIVVNNNYFSNITRENVVVNYNELNPMRIEDNYWEGIGDFYHDISPRNPNIVVQNNAIVQIEPLLIVDPENGDFNLAIQNPDQYKVLGPQTGLGHKFNYTPSIGLVDDIVIESGADTILLFTAETFDNDSVKIMLSTLPQFTQIINNENGKFELHLAPKAEHEGIYPIILTASDYSHHAKARKQFNIAVRSKDNSPPILTFSNIVEVVVNKRQQFPISYSDADGDRLTITAENFPPFVKLLSNDMQEYMIELYPHFADEGVYNQLQIIATDGFNEPKVVEFTVIVETFKLSKGDVVYRVNCGGPSIDDEPTEWEGNYNNPLYYELSKNHSTGSHSWNGKNTSSAPSCIFGPWNYTLNNEAMHWIFPCQNGMYTVNLFFAENEKDFLDTKESVFSIEINGDIEAENFSIYKYAGFNALKKTFFVTSIQSQLEIRLLPLQNQVKLNGIEIKFGYLPGKEFNLPENTTYHLFPNPVNDWFYVFSLSDTLIGGYDFKIYNTNGQKLDDFPIFADNPHFLKVNIDRNKIKNGTYLLHMSGHDGISKVFKLIIR
ncbi:malectin domain-containing carbohydrate-binding protein [Roseimarinus sediminis]|jgi:hypothetical protein|uniref:malectin domain-containing carbohydrate-binding protein n=1 Tax=Roseimarinus sediminis TaxID=1610899 RepID=UPI003D1E6F8A